jgi:hypothetical protein
MWRGRTVRGRKVRGPERAHLCAPANWQLLCPLCSLLSAPEASEHGQREGGREVGRGDWAGYLRQRHLTHLGSKGRVSAVDARSRSLPRRLLVIHALPHKRTRTHTWRYEQVLMDATDASACVPRGELHQRGQLQRGQLHEKAQLPDTAHLMRKLSTHVAQRRASLDVGDGVRGADTSCWHLLTPSADTFC